MSLDRVHPEIPTIYEIEHNQASVNSNHLPIFLEAPLTSHEFTTDLKIISLNTLISNNPSGFHKKNEWETPEQAQQRYKRIVACLSFALLNRRPHIIALQETNVIAITPELEKTLSMEWTIIPCEQNNMLVCIKKNEFPVVEHTYDVKLRIQKITLQDKNHSSKKFNFYNVWFKPNELTYRVEKTIETLLEDSNTNINIIAGDFNTHIAPTHDKSINITTAINPYDSNNNHHAKQDMQIPDFLDGGFYSVALDDENKTRKIHQLQRKILNFQTGAITVDLNIEKDINPWPEYKMIICLDKKYKTKKFIMDKTIYEFENEIREKWNKEDIHVRIAANIYNKKALAIQLPLVLRDKYEAIQNFIHEKEGFQFNSVYDNNSGAELPCIFAPLAKATLLYNAIFPDKIIFDLINNHKEILTTDISCNIFKKNSELKVSSFEKLTLSLQQPTRNKTYRELIEAWEAEEAYRTSDNKEKSIRDIMADHRECFSSLFAPITNTESKSIQFIDRLKNKFGDFKPLINMLEIKEKLQI